MAPPSGLGRPKLPAYTMQAREHTSFYSALYRVLCFRHRACRELESVDPVDVCHRSVIIGIAGVSK